ncbi:hypothetical protein R6Q57_024328 [Mikania cordata]
MKIKDQQEEMKRKSDKGKEIESDGEFGRISTVDEMVVFLDLLNSVGVNLLNTVSLRKKFEEMVKWFIKYVIKQPSSWPPMIENQIVNLYDLNLSVQINGGKDAVTTHNFWVLMAADMGLDSRKGYKLMLTYNTYLDLMEWFYKNLKERKSQQGIYTFNMGESSTKDQYKEKSRLRGGIASTSWRWFWKFVLKMGDPLPQVVDVG